MEAGQVAGYFSVDQLYRDSTHLNDIGRYVAGITAFATIYQQNPIGMVKPDGFYGDDPAAFTAELYAVIHNTVWEVVSGHPFTGVS